MKQVLFALASVVLVSLCRGDCTQFCHGQLCPECTVVETNEKFEKRNYVATTWLSTPVDGEDGAHLVDATNRLRDCWDKQNQNGVKMPNSWPVQITRRTAGNAVVVMLSWFLPPTLPDLDLSICDKSITLDKRDAAIVIVRWFGGQPDPSSAQENAKILTEDLTEAGISFDSQTSTGAFYEPYLSPSHNNEIWLYAKSELQ